MEVIRLQEPGREYALGSGTLAITLDESLFKENRGHTFVLGISKKSHSNLDGRLQYNGQWLDIGGWYREVHIQEYTGSELIIESLISDVTLVFWFEPTDPTAPTLRMNGKKDDGFDFWFNWNVNYSCNFDCPYCVNSPGKYRTNSIDLARLRDNFKGVEARFKFTFIGGGEPFLVPNLIETCEFLTEKHSVSFISNLSSPKVTDLIGRVAPDKVAFILASCHIQQLEERKLFDRFVSHFHQLREAGYAIHAQAVAYPALIEECEKYKERFKNEQISFVFAPFYGEYKGKRYPEAYSESELELFGLPADTRGFYSSKGRLCNAGFNVAVVHPLGDMITCDPCKEWMGNIYDQFDVSALLKSCPVESCNCPFPEHDLSHFERAMELTNGGNTPFEHIFWNHTDAVGV